MRGESMDAKRKQELIELFKQTSYMPYHEVLGLLMACLPERFKLIKRMLVDDIRQFNLKIYFRSTYSYDGEIPLSDPVAVTSDTLGYHVPPPSENYANFWLFGELSTSEVNVWLQSKGIIIPSLETSANHMIDHPANELSTLADAANKALPQDVSSGNEERTFITVNVPASLWAGKSPKAIFAILSEKDFAPEVIAHVLLEKAGGISKTDAGRLFSQEDIDKGVEQEPRTYQRKMDALLNEANSKYSFTFNG